MELPFHLRMLGRDVVSFLLGTPFTNASGPKTTRNWTNPLRHAFPLFGCRLGLRIFQIEVLLEVSYIAYRRMTCASDIWNDRWGQSTEVSAGRIGSRSNYA